MARGEPLIRQWNLIKALQAHHFGISADELAARVGCSKRQVQRDLNVLQQVGFPISFEQRDFGKKYWKLLSRFVESEHLMLSMTEMLSLFLSRQLLSPLAGTQLGDGLATALEKIKTLLSKRALYHFDNIHENVFVKRVASHDYSAQDKEIAILNRAIAESRAVKIHYKSARSGRTIDSLLHPYGLVLYGMSLYCIGWLIDRGEIRTLKVSRIAGVQMTDKRFEKPDTFSLESYLQGSFGMFSSGKLQTVRVKFTGWAATSVREQQRHDSQKITKSTKDYVIARFELSDLTEFKRWILGFGQHAVVLSPKKLVKEIASELAQAKAAYAPEFT